MRFMSRLVQVMAVLVTLGLSGSAWAAPKTLIELDGGKPKAGLAKSWKKVKDGEYEFEIDTAAEVKAGTKLTAAMVKDSLESKLGTTYGVKVTPKGASKVAVAYTGDEAKFLEQVSKTKIRGGKDVELALESSVSDGGIRAKKADRPPTDGEVKAIAIKIEKGMITAKVNATKSDKIKNGEKITVKGEVKGLKKNESFFFKPEKKEGASWVPVNGSLQ